MDVQASEIRSIAEVREITMDWETLVAQGIKVSYRLQASQWELGDLALQVATHYGREDLLRYA